MDQTYLKKLAYEIATNLDDLDALAWHETLVEKYNEEFLRQMMVKALAISEKNIRKSILAKY